MTPIEYRVDSAFIQALNCAEYRVPRDVRLLQPAFSLALGIRYGMLAAAATHQLFGVTEDSEMAAVRSATKDWEHLVDAHLRLSLARRIPAERGGVDHERVARYSDQTFHGYLSDYYRGASLAACLEGVMRTMSSRYRAEISRGWPWHRALGARRVYAATGADSLRYALLFFDRRKAGLEELPEIALLGE